MDHRVCLATLLIITLISSVFCTWASASPSQTAGLLLQALSSEKLDEVQAEIGYRVGVLVHAVKASSPAANAGVKAGDILFTVGEDGVDSPEAVDQALSGKTGGVEVLGFRPNPDGEGMLLQLKIQMPAGGQVTVPAEAAPVAAGTAPGGSPAKAAGFELVALPEPELDAVEKETGYRVGVFVKSVTPDSPAAKAGIQGDDVLFTVANQGVDSPEAVDQVLTGKAGQIAVLAVRKNAQGGYDPVQVTMDMAQPATPAPTTAPDAETQRKLTALEAAYQAGVLSKAEYEAKTAELVPTAQPTAQPTATVPVGVQSQPSVLGAYLDMLDFMRTQGLGKQMVTSAADRQRLSAALAAADPAGQQAIRTALQQASQTWADIQAKWQTATEDKREKQRAHWRKQVLLPALVYPPPAQVQTFRGRNDRIVFEYPNGWLVDQTEDEDGQYLYLGPAGTETTWAQVLDPAASAPGALLAVMPTPPEFKEVQTFVQAARLAAGQFVAIGGAQMQEIGAVDLEEGAIVTLRGRYPGQREDKFYWVGVVRYGPDYILAGRLGGPVSKADMLVPMFSHMLMTMELNPPEGGDYHSAMVGYYTSAMGNAVVSAGWD